MLQLILGAGFIVQCVLMALVALSVASWAIIAFKVRELARAENGSDDLLEVYWGGSLDATYDVARRLHGNPFSTVFIAGYSDVEKLKRMGARNELSHEEAGAIAQRLAWVETEEAHRLERGLSFLATTGNSAPFIGLFGTVVGILNAFHNIGQTGSASLAIVAPGIAEALIATAVGLFAAIPAVIAFNYLGARVGRLVEKLVAFRTELAGALRRLASQID